MLAIIPARSGSKRFPNKNTKLLMGKPLVSYTIEAALGSSVVGDIIVISNDEDVMEIAEEYEVTLIDEPTELARPKVPMIDVALYVLKKWDEDKVLPPSFVVLPPTSPLRTVYDIREAWMVMYKYRAYSVISVRRVREHPDWMKVVTTGSKIVGCFDGPADKVVSQDFITLYYPNGALYMCNTEEFMIHETFYTDRTYAYHMPPERSVDIDYEIDFKFAEFLLENIDV